MFPPRSISLAAVLALFFLDVAAFATPVALRTVDATYNMGLPQMLREVIDGRDTGQFGWSVAPRVAEEQRLMVTTAEPVRAQAFGVTLCFLSGGQGRYCGEFSLSCTIDPHPSLNSVWMPLEPDRISAVGTSLTNSENGHLISGPSDSMVGDAVFEIWATAPMQGVTAFCLNVYPFWPPNGDRPRLSWARDGDICLTEFRVEAIQPHTTNLALGCPVWSSHALWAGISAAALTDGLPGSYAHPWRSDLGSAFYFELDLGGNRSIDHISLRSRADGYGLDRMSKIVLKLYEKAPEDGGQPIWSARDRADGSHPGAGQTDVVRANEGRGRCRGRYLRISSESAVANSPQLAEVEVYGSLTPRLVSMKADGNLLAGKPDLVVPSGSAGLTFLLEIAGDGAVEPLAVRWRLRGLHEDWKISTALQEEVFQPRPGLYQFEAQVQHTDGEWDASALSFPVKVQAPFWRTPAFSWSVSVLALLAAFWSVREVGRRRHAKKIAALEYHSALAEERTRIARDMHDEVGARLSQLAVMQDILIRQHPVTDEARQKLEQVAETARHAAEALDEVVWAVNPRKDTLPSLADYLAQCATSYLGAIEIDCELDAPLQWPPLEIRAPVRHQLALAFKEALQNVAKHSGATAVVLKLAQEGQEFVVQLADNGGGLHRHPAASGRNGLENMQSRLAAAGGKCEVRAAPGGGTVVEFRVPLPA